MGLDETYYISIAENGNIDILRGFRRYVVVAASGNIKRSLVLVVGATGTCAALIATSSTTSLDGTPYHHPTPLNYAKKLNVLPFASSNHSPLGVGLFLRCVCEFDQLVYCPILKKER